MNGRRRYLWFLSGKMESWHSDRTKKERCRQPASQCPIGGFCQEWTFRLVDVNDWCWVASSRSSLLIGWLLSTSQRLELASLQLAQLPHFRIRQSRQTTSHAHFGCLGSTAKCLQVDEFANRPKEAFAMRKQPLNLLAPAARYLAGVGCGELVDQIAGAFSD
jgi:hypothetical protein